jgi:hypothetical protein
MDVLHDGRRLPMDELPKCPRCDGTGEVDSGGSDPQGNWINIRCPDCNGTGYQEEGDEEIPFKSFRKMDADVYRRYIHGEDTATLRHRGEY